MYNSTPVMVLLALQVGLVYSFSWDIVVGEEKLLQFYYNGTLTHTEHIPSANSIRSVTYDPVHYRVLFNEMNSVNHSVFSFDLSTRTIKPIFNSNKTDVIYYLSYDPVTQLLFWQEGQTGVCSYSLDPASSNKVADRNRFVETSHDCWDIAVDSCGGFIYWITDYEIERARFDGSEREVVVGSHVYQRSSLAIDQPTQKMYWIEIIQKNDGNQLSIESADLKAKNKTTYIVKNDRLATSLAVSKDCIYWRGNYQNGIYKLQKHTPQSVEAKLFSVPHSNFYWNCQSIAANYTINELFGKNQKCESLKSVIPNFSESHSLDVSVLCVHGTKSSGESRCECTLGYTGEICDVNICQNYCFHGDCSVSAEGQPKCSCKAGYYGERCEVNACHGYCLNDGVCALNDQHSPICKCTADHEGARCDVSICKDYCLQGNCSVSTEGQPKCSCTVGYSGERCEVDACHDYCSNNGICSLNEEDEPVCECTADYEGVKCDVPTCKADCASDEGQTKYRRYSNAGNSAERKVNACHQYCLNDGTCSLNKENVPVCQCTADYEGERCDVPAFLIKCFLYAYKNLSPVTVSKGVESTCASTVV